MSAPVILTRYECIVHPSNLHAGYGKPVTVFADNQQQAVDRAIAVGWVGHARDARVTVRKVEQVVVNPEDVTP